MGVSCERCGSGISPGDWFCNHCGKERPRCPDCGADMDQFSCRNCGTVRQAPCDDCGLLIPATASVCPNCDYDPVRETEEYYQSELKKYLLGVGLGVGAFLVIGGIVPGPAIIGDALGVLVGGPIVSIAGLGALRAKRKADNADQQTPINLRKGRKQNKSRAWRQKEKEQREAALDAAAKGLDAVSDAAESWGDSGSSSSSSSSGSVGRSAETFELSAVAGGVEFEMNCPSCGQHWRVADPGLSRGYRLDGAKAIEDLNAINDTKVQCEACGRTEYINSWE